MKIKSLKEMFDYLDTINDVNNLEYDYCKMESYGLFEIYEDFLEAILKLEEKPKRVIDIGSNMNQYAYIFENAGIDYIGIDVCKNFVPYESEHAKFIWAKYEDIADLFKDDILISDLCVDYLVKREDVKAKHLFTNSDFTNDTNIVQWW